MDHCQDNSRMSVNGRPSYVNCWQYLRCFQQWFGMYVSKSGDCCDLQGAFCFLCVDTLFAECVGF